MKKIDLVIEIGTYLSEKSFSSPIESLLYLAEMKMLYGGYYIWKNSRNLDLAITFHGIPSLLMFDGPPEDIAFMHKFFLFDELTEMYAEESCGYVPVPLCGRYGDGSVVVPPYLPALVKKCGKAERVKISYMLAFGVRKEEEIRGNLHVPLEGIATAIRNTICAPSSFPERET